MYHHESTIRLNNVKIDETAISFFHCMSRGNRKKKIIHIYGHLFPFSPFTSVFSMRLVCSSTVTDSDNNRKRKKKNKKKSTSEKMDQNESGSNRMCVIGVYQYFKFETIVIK